MRIRILDRILVALAGLILVAACAGVVAQVFFGVDVLDAVAKALTPETTTGKVIVGACAALLFLIGVYCLLVLFRHRSKKDKFVLQKLESGELAISLNTLETMVQKCLDQHTEIKTESVKLENQRDGLLIRIRGSVASGISIPLTVDSLQKEIKQYVTACSGVEVKGIRVQIESSGEEAKDALYAIEPPASMLLTRGSEEQESQEEKAQAETAAEPEAVQTETSAPETENKPQGEEAAAAAAMAAAESLMNGIETEDDDRPIHQRLFSMQEEPCIMPLPPENLAQDEEVKETAEKPAETEEESAVKNESAETAETAETKGEDNA